MEQPLLLFGLASVWITGVQIYNVMHYSSEASTIEQPDNVKHLTTFNLLSNSSPTHNNIISTVVPLLSQLIGL